MEEDGFRLVVRKKKSKTRHHMSVAEYLDLFNCVSVERIDKVMDIAVKTMQKSLFGAQIVKLISRILVRLGKNYFLAQIRSIGVGHFCENNHAYGCHQLALILLLKQHFNCRVTFQDPISTENEQEWLRSREIEVLKSTDLEEPTASSEKNAATLFYMPHCDFALYNSVIYAHRTENLLSNIIFFGNDLVSFEANPKYALELECMIAYRKVCERVLLPKYEDNEAAFSNTAIHFLEQKLPKIPNSKPLYNFYKVVAAY